MQQSVPLPLPLLPVPPVLLIVKQPPLRTELSLEEKRKGWAERIQWVPRFFTAGPLISFCARRLLSNSLQQRCELTKIDQDIGVIRRLLHFAPSSPSDFRRGIENKLGKLELQREEARKEYDVILTRVTAIDNWPVPPSVENDDRETLNKMLKYCEDLQHSAEEVNRVLSRPDSALSLNDTLASDPSRPLKRRRLDEDVDQERQGSNTLSDIHEELRDRALAIQGTISNIQNDQVANRNDLVAECKEYTENKFEEATVEATKSIQGVEDKVRALEGNINSTGDDVGELAGVIGELILHNNEFKTEIAETNRKIQDTQARVARLEERMREITQERSQFAKTIEALKAAHDAHMARPISPPVSPSLPPLDYIVQSVHDPLLEAARSAIKPMLSNMRDNIQGLLQERHAEMYQTLWKRLSLTLRLVDALSARLPPPQGDRDRSGDT
ncbi:hypothetical protein AX15_003913 [Amanita polypyramis BW_CC]|nr:hypothetical protein AX15_003913 [Amanita polypyramis BW_CC]